MTLPNRSEARSLPRLHASVFVKLMAIMLGIGVFIPLVVAGFFLFMVRPAMYGAAERMMAGYVELLATSDLDRATALAQAPPLGLAVRYEGPRGGWSTRADLPAIDTVRDPAAGSGWSRFPFVNPSYVVRRPGPQGGAYLFVWDYQHDLAAAHDRMLVILLLLLVVAVAAAYVLLSRALRPLRWLHDGVAMLSQGNLEVTVTRRSNDELGLLTDAFNQMVARVRGMVHDRDQLLLDVSHELRSPLTRMKVALELTANHDEHTARMAANITEMETLISELLEIERLRQGKGLQTETHDFMAIVREVLGSFETRSPGVELNAGPAKLALTIDADKTRRVLLNLVDNALKYSLSDSSKVRVSVAETATSVIVCIVDDGPGIPPADLPRLFEPFFRVDRSRSRKTGGYGLGLSLCRRIMEAHGGSIAVENNSDSACRGATFVLTFPKGVGDSEA